MGDPPSNSPILPLRRESEKAPAPSRSPFLRYRPNILLKERREALPQGILVLTRVGRLQVGQGWAGKQLSPAAPLFFSCYRPVFLWEQGRIFYIIMLYRRGPPEPVAPEPQNRGCIPHECLVTFLGKNCRIWRNKTF